MLVTGKQQKKIDYFGILKKSWQITWNNKYLWWFGLFMALGSGGANFNFSFDGSGWGDKTETPQEAQEAFANFVSQYSGWIIAGLSLLAVLVIIFLILRIIGQVGIIKSVDNIEKGKRSNFSAGLKEGKKYFWKVFFTGLLIGLFILAIIIILFLPVASLFYLKSFIIGTITALLAIIIFVPLVILASFIKIYSYLYIVLGNLSIRSALENAYRTFRNNLFSSIVMGLVFIPLVMLMGIAMIFVIVSLAIVFLVVGLIFYFILNKIGIIITIVLGAISLLFIVLLIKSVYETFHQAAWVLFFREIALVKDKGMGEIEEELINKKVPEPERA
ncbi:hypothetical protein BMS3Abin15_00440 [bacterium BMS3Abin15]|nr:hypothetical protein BMS3Abin15_00440 [bacterium BMS3Abin15]HDZ85054.1 hypothetical protein [Candidatus Moranbacteria bacterium]